MKTTFHKFTFILDPKEGQLRVLVEFSVNHSDNENVSISTHTVDMFLGYGVLESNNMDSILNKLVQQEVPDITPKDVRIICRAILGFLRGIKPGLEGDNDFTTVD